jgi:O-antigen/teichoic acid export membrane protein
MIVLFIIRGYIADYLNAPELSSYLLIFLPFVILYPIARVAFGTLRAEGRSKEAVISRNVARRVIPLVILFIAIDYGVPKLGAVLYWIGLPFVLILFSMYYIRDVFKIKNLFRTPESETFRSLISFSWPLAASTFIFIFLSKLDILMIAYFLSQTDVGYYRSINPLKQAATLMMGAFSFIYLPLATQHYEAGDLEGLKKLYQISTKWILVGTFPVVVVFGLFSPDVMRVFFGEEFRPAASALTILMFGLLFRSVVGLNGTMVEAVNITKVSMFAGTGGLVTNFAFNLVLIPRFGINGAAIATVVGYFVYNSIEVTSVYWVTRAHPFAFDNFKPLIMMFTIALIVREVVYSYTLDLIHLIGIGIFLSIVQLSAVFITRSTSAMDIKVIKEIESKYGYQLGWLKSISKK